MIIEHKKCISNKQLHQNLRKQTKERKKKRITLEEVATKREPIHIEFNASVKI